MHILASRARHLRAPVPCAAQRRCSIAFAQRLFCSPRYRTAPPRSAARDTAAPFPTARALNAPQTTMAAMLGSDLKSRMAREVRQLAQTPPEGVKYVETDADALTEVHADLTGPEGTPYAGAVFRLKLVIGSEFPSAPPRGFFLTKIFHPNVATNGDICVNTLKRDWKPETTLSHILQVIRCLLIVPFPESSLNDEAGKLFMTSYDQYAQRAKLMTDFHASPIQPHRSAPRRRPHWEIIMARANRAPTPRPSRSRSSRC